MVVALWAVECGCYGRIRGIVAVNFSVRTGGDSGRTRRLDAERTGALYILYSKPNLPMTLGTVVVGLVRFYRCS